VEDQQLTLIEQLILDNSGLIMVVGIVLVIALVVIVIGVITKRDLTVEIGGNKVSFGGKKRNFLDTLMDIRDQKKDAEMRTHREIISDQKEHVQIRLPKLKNLLRCCTDDAKEHLIKTISLEWTLILHGIAERNAIEEKFDGDTLKSDYSKSKIDQFLEVYKESQQLDWSSLPDSQEIKDGLEDIFQDIMLELRDIARTKREELKEILAGLDRIASGIEGEQPKE
jgi:hypothetical protein